MLPISSQLPNGINFPTWWQGVNGLLFAYYRLRYGGRCSVMEEDWDNLIILDACRYDTFRNHHELNGTLEPRISQGTATGNFLNGNFGDGEYYDTVYVTGNPHVSRLCEGQFHSIIPVWETDWDDELKTVTPEAMVNATIKAQSKFPNKRIISHLVQPHAPFIGENARESFGVETGITLNRMMAQGKENTDYSKREEYPNAWSRLQSEEITTEQILEAYCENLEVALDSVAELIEKLRGKTVITADHGEMFGEMALPLPIRRVGHSGKVFTPLLVKVPWFIINSNSRKEIQSERPSTMGDDQGEEMRKKLEHLGYVE